MLVKDLYLLFFPKYCAGCDTQLLKNEKTLCLSCMHKLPVTDFTEEANNKVEQTFYGRIKLVFGTALLFYKDEGLTQHIIHQLKYNGNQEVGFFLGDLLGCELLNSKRFQNIDCIIPVPLHPKKLKKRGYNQLTTFGKRIANILNVAYIENVLIRKKRTDTQTKRGRLERWINVQDIFYLKEEQALQNKHILLIDDVITTGATLEACALELLKIPNVKISIATMAYTE